MFDELSPLTEHHLAHRLVLARPSVGTVNLARNARWQWYFDLEVASGQAPQPGPGSVAAVRWPSSRSALHVPDRRDPEVRAGHGLRAAHQPAQPRALPAPASRGCAGLWPGRADPVLPDVLSAVPGLGGTHRGRRAPAHWEAGAAALVALGSARHRWEPLGGQGPSASGRRASPAPHPSPRPPALL